MPSNYELRVPKKGEWYEHRDPYLDENVLGVIVQASRDNPSRLGFERRIFDRKVERVTE